MKILVEKAVIEQALEALELFGIDDMAYIKSEKAITALREALAELDIEEMTLTQIAARHEQAEQEPVACERCEELAADKGTWYRMAERFAIRNEELKKALAQALNLIEGEWPEGDEIAQPVIDTMKATLANQPASVRTKDLTDDEIAEAVGSPLDEVYLADFRAVIAADREKNK